MIVATCGQAQLVECWAEMGRGTVARRLSIQIPPCPRIPYCRLSPIASSQLSQARLLLLIAPGERCSRCKGVVKHGIELARFSHNAGSCSGERRFGGLLWGLHGAPAAGWGTLPDAGRSLILSSLLYIYTVVEMRVGTVIATCAGANILLVAARFGILGLVWDCDNSDSVTNYFHICDVRHRLLSCMAS